MKISVAYIAVTHGPITHEYCSRFAATYHEYPPGYDHELIVVCNGGPLQNKIGLTLSGINPRYYIRKNDQGFDISAYIELANGICRDSDMLVCLGESVFFHRGLWLKRFVYAWETYGAGMYGPFSSNLLRPHLNTSAFCCHPMLIREYPFKVSDHNSRYEFEHGQHSFWKYVQKRAMPVRLVTWDGEYPPNEWRSPPDILWRGSQRNCLMFCNHTERWASSGLRIKQQWSRGADSRFANK